MKTGRCRFKLDIVMVINIYINTQLRTFAGTVFKMTVMDMPDTQCV